MKISQLFIGLVACSAVFAHAGNRVEMGHH